MFIELENIHKHFGRVHANAGISLTVPEGRIMGLLGENGAGKTTLAKILSGYQTHDAGTIYLDGKQASFRSPAEAIRAGIGMLHQDPLDVPALSVLENFELGGLQSGLRKSRASAARLQELCKRFGFSLDADAAVSSLTIGERQQLEIVRLLDQGVQVLILDEPTTGISSPQKMLLFRTLHRLASEGISIIFVSHKLDEVEQLCSSVTVLRRGQVAGSLESPFSPADLVLLMFGKALDITERPDVPLGDSLVELRDGTIRTYRLTMDHLTLELRAGEVVGLAGLEGSGQQLLMRACAGIQPLAGGTLAIAGQDMTRKNYREFARLGVRFVPAARLEEGLISGMSIREHYALIDPNQGNVIAWGNAQTQAAEKISEYNIVGSPDSLVQALSGGNQQRLLLAMLPEKLALLILEHPTRGLDIGSSRWIWEHLLERRLQGTAILFTSTDLDELVKYSDRVIVFSGGMMSAPTPASQVTSESLGYMIGGNLR